MLALSLGGCASSLQRSDVDTACDDASLMIVIEERFYCGAYRSAAVSRGPAYAKDYTGVRRTGVPVVFIFVTLGIIAVFLLL